MRVTPITPAAIFLLVPGHTNRPGTGIVIG
jgi:hypothetical protein